MGIIENFKKLGYRFTSTQQKPKMTKREALSKIHALMCYVDDGTPITMQQKFEKIDVDKYTDAQIKDIFNHITTLIKQVKLPNE
jgi:hypothetical protein